MQSGDVQWVRSRQPGTVGPLRLVRRLFPEHAPPPRGSGPSEPGPRERLSPRSKALAPGSSLSIHLPGMSRSLLHLMGEAAHATRLHVAEGQPRSVWGGGAGGGCWLSPSPDAHCGLVSPLHRSTSPCCRRSCTRAGCRPSARC